jgi:hypothetical protein
VRMTQREERRGHHIGVAVRVANQLVPGDGRRTHRGVMAGFHEETQCRSIRDEPARPLPTGERRAHTEPRGRARPGRECTRRGDSTRRAECMIGCAVLTCIHAATDARVRRVQRARVLRCTRHRERLAVLSETNLLRLPLPLVQLILLARLGVHRVEPRIRRDVLDRNDVVRVTTRQSGSG